VFVIYIYLYNSFYSYAIFVHIMHATDVGAFVSYPSSCNDFVKCTTFPIVLWNPIVNFMVYFIILGLVLSCVAAYTIPRHLIISSAWVVLVYCFKLTMMWYQSNTLILLQSKLQKLKWMYNMFILQAYYMTRN